MSRVICKSVELTKWTIGVVLASALVGCGGGVGSSAPAPVAVVAADAQVPMTQATVAALVPAAGAAPIVATFNSGVSGTNAAGAAVHLTGPTTVAFSAPATGTTPVFTIKNGTGTATGNTTFGSCDFTVVTSTIPALPVDTVLKVDPCKLTVPTSGDPANGTTTTQNVVFTLGNATSTDIPLAVTIASTGAVTVGGTVVATVTITVLTGAGG